VRPLVDVPEEQFLVLPCGVDVDQFHPEAIGDVHERYGLTDPYVICPGALTTAKGPQNVVVASEHYGDLAETIFIGAGVLRDALEENLGDRGRFLGFVSAEDKAALINGAAVLTAAPEKREHFGIIYVEGMAGGTVPVAYEGGGVGSIVTSDTGVLTARNPDVLGLAIRDVLLDAERRNVMAEAARGRAVRHFDTRTLGERLVSWLDGLAA
jgi:glycosyltransferase involved in cell wall biosynthesis